MRIIHTADWQIGRAWGQFETETAVMLNQARFNSIERIAALCNEKDAVAVVVAGDVFDAQGVSEKTIRQMFNAMAGYRGTWILMPGNHDAALTESVWTRAARMGVIPANVIVVTQPGVIRLDDARVEFVVAPLTQRQVYSDTTAHFDASRHETPEGYFRIGIAHGSVEGYLPDNIDATNPIAADRAQTAGLDYLALGDWHGTLCINDRTWYSGTHETDRFRNNDSGNALVVDIASPGATPDVTPHRVGQMQWEEISFSMRVPEDVDALRNLLATMGRNHIISLRLDGAVTLMDNAALRVVLGEVEARVGGLRVYREALRILPSEEDIQSLHVDGYLGDVLETLRAGGEVSDEVRNEALIILADALMAHTDQGAAV